MKEMMSYQELLEKRVQDCIRGSLMAGAAGDALGYAVEFKSRESILARYGKWGITEFELNARGKALISDDTQMTLYTANGILMGLTRGYMRGIGGEPQYYVSCAYQDWYRTQMTERPLDEHSHTHTWISKLPEMAHRRTPGTTCLKACEQIIRHREVENNSKGCGGIMRVAPMALFAAGHDVKNGGGFIDEIKYVGEAGGYIAQVTHKHPLGFLPAALLTALLYRLVPRSVRWIKEHIYEVVEENLRLLDKLYPGEYQHEKGQLRHLSERAILLAGSDRTSAEAIRELGEGWVAEEAWAIALFCTLRHISRPRRAILAAVNHDGDSDSTGSITGNILGAIYGYNYFKERNIFCTEGCQLESTLELSEVILALADDLFTGCIISEYDPINTPRKRQWYERYCGMYPAGISSFREAVSHR